MKTGPALAQANKLSVYIFAKIGIFFVLNMAKVLMTRMAICLKRKETLLIGSWPMGNPGP